MNSWQSGWEANKNKPVVQFLATAAKLGITTVNCGIFKVKIQRRREGKGGENSGYSCRRALRGASLSPSPASTQPWTRVCGHRRPVLCGALVLGIISAAVIWERCMLLVSLGGQISQAPLAAHLWSQWLMYACVYSSNRGLFSKGVDCLHLVHDFWGAVLLNLYKARSRRWLLQRALLPLILCKRKINRNFVCCVIFEFE